MPNYTSCYANDKEMFNVTTGIVTIPESGSYVLAFHARMIMLEGKRVHCYMKRERKEKVFNLAHILKNTSNDGIEAAKWDSQDTNSMSVIASLEKGDLVYVTMSRWGKSHISKSIFFSGFLLK